MLDYKEYSQVDSQIIDDIPVDQVVEEIRDILRKN